MNNRKSSPRAPAGSNLAESGAKTSATSRADWSAIRQKLRDFVGVYRDANYERGQAQPYWNALLRCFDVGEPVLKKAFEHRLKLGTKNNYVDAFIPGKLIVEHKGSHVDLGSAVEQLQGYYGLLPPSEQPRYAVLCNFQQLRLYDFSNLARTVVHECGIDELPEKAELFKFLLPAEDSVGFLEQPGVDIKAARAVADLHAALTADGYGGRDLEVLLTRLIFCFFGDDTGIFGENTLVHRLLLNSAEDGSDLGSTLSKLFEVLDTPVAKRSTKLPAKFADFAFVNGQLFSESCRLPDFDAAQRAVILQCSALNWGSISPAIFGSMFQAVLENGRKDAKKLAAARRELGAHYTSERNILRALGPLFLDELKDELEAAKRNKDKLLALHKRLAGIRLLDPACGCGNFLVVAFQQLRLLEIELVYRLHGDSTKSRGLLDMRDMLQVQVDQFYGIEIDPSATHITRVALWITDHQMNLVAAQRLGQARPSVPLTHSATIAEGNALQLDWAAVLPPAQCSYVVGNPPFVGKHYRKPAQQEDLVTVLDGTKGAGDLDYVAAWYIKAARFIQGTAIKCAFVSTNSICQGEQVPVLWPLLFGYGVHIHFAHQTFQWNNEAVGKAAVHCVIIGFALDKPKLCQLFTYSSVRSEECERSDLTHINAYLTGGPNVIVTKAQKPITPRPVMKCGNKPTDDGHLLLTLAERQSLLEEEPAAAQFIRKFVGSEEYLNKIDRYCLWLSDVSPAQLKKMPAVMNRVDAVRKFREASTAAPTRKSAQTPTRFFFESQPKGTYILMPEVSSERRKYVPVSLMSSDVISSNKNYLIDDSDLFVAGLLQSAMHMGWMRTVGGRLKSDYQYSGTMVYNTFPWPTATDKKRTVIEQCVQSIFDIRTKFSDASLADLYDPLTMPPELLKAHQKLDKAVDAAYGYTGKSDDAARVAFLFGRYQQLVVSEADAEKK